MEAFERFAPQLARCALNKLALNEEERRGITHVIVTSCTGLYAPGLDYDIVNHLGLEPFRGTNHDRLHGLLRRHQRPEVCPSHHSV